MALNDSLDVTDDDTENTFRVDYPYPHSIKNEDEFMVNSARRFKTQPVLPLDSSKQLNETDPQEISDSLQAELHLSLDRLSENSYDQDDLTRIKLKSQSGVKRSKMYPMLHNASQSSMSEQKEMLNMNSSALTSNVNNVNTSNHAPVVPLEGLSVQDSLSIHPMNTSTQKRNTGEPVLDDEEDDASTIVVEDSLSFTERMKSNYEENQSDFQRLQPHPSGNPSQDKSDPYAHLRYDPEWRNDTVLTSGGEDGEHLKQNVSNFENQLTSNPTFSEGGAITIYNQELLQTRDSPVRLSADPSKLLLLNEKYENEFDRLLKQEQQWKVEEEHDPLSPAFNPNLLNQSPVKSNLKPPAPVKKLTSETSTNIKAETENSPKLKASDLNKSSKKGKKTSLHAPSPPKAPKSTRDYIELNKTRLGRKSNSASYLEMYSKKNRIQEQVRLSPRRPLSDIRQTQKRSEKHPDYHNVIEDDISPSNVEEIWKKQANRLKLAKEGKSNNNKSSERRTLKEVGNHASSKPVLSPRRFFNTSPQHEHNHKISPRDLSPGKTTSSSHDHSFRMKSDFTNHPAFTPFSQQDGSYRSDDQSWSQEPVYSSGKESESDPYYRTEPKSHYHDGSNMHHENEHRQYHPNALKPYRELEPNSPYRIEQSPHHNPAFNTNLNPHYSNTSMPGSYYLSKSSHFHQVRNEDIGNHPSPMMQAYQQRFVHPTHNHANNNIQINNNPSNFVEASGHYSNRLSSQNTFQHEGQTWNEFHSPPKQDIDSNRFNSIPRLPPIPNKLGIEEGADNSGVMRQSMSDSDAAVGGSYLQQHEKKKVKPTYKRYTLDDYKSLKRDINMGGLGPDLVASKLKMEKVDRVKKYSEFIRQQHKINVVRTSEDQADDELFYVETRQRFTLGESERKKQELLERRKKALDYAKKVPKPKAVVSPIAMTNHQPRVMSHNDELELSDRTLEWDLLKTLRDRHEKEKALVAEMTSPRRVT